MMYYKFFVVFLDGETIDIAVRESQKNNFLKSLSHNEPFYDEEANSGLYLGSHVMRYCTFAHLESPDVPKETPEPVHTINENSEIPQVIVSED